MDLNFAQDDLNSSMKIVTVSSNTIIDVTLYQKPISDMIFLFYKSLIVRYRV